MKKLEDYSQLAKERGFIFAPQPITTTQQKYTWKCGKGHEWQAKYSNIKYRLSGCPFCSGLSAKSIEDYLLLAKKYDLTLIKMAKNTHTKSTWRCKRGHTFEAKYNLIHSQGRSCMQCSHRNPKTEQDYLNLAAKHNIKYVGPFPQSVIYKTNWICKCGSKMTKSYNKIFLRPNCKKCGYLKITGKNSYLYNPSLSKEQREKRRIAFHFTEWTKNIYKKWNYTCQKCKTWSNPRAHHIFNWNDYPNYRMDINNGIVLCESCHIDFHCQYGKKNNTLIQIENFTNQTFPELHKYFDN